MAEKERITTSGKRQKASGENPSNPSQDTEIDAIFRILGMEDAESIPLQKLHGSVTESGLSIKDPRLKESLGLYPDKDSHTVRLQPEDVRRLLQADSSGLLRQALRKQLVIPDFLSFKKDIEEIFEQIKGNTEGEVDEQLPHPGTENPPAFAVSICTTDGQILQLGDHELDFSIQSICKPINYAIALEEKGQENVHKYVGVEPGGEDFHTGMVLNEQDLPHNPLINSGAIMVSSLIKPESALDERLKYVMSVWEKLSGDKPVAYKEEAFEAERKTADKNLALTYLMNERGAFPEGIDLLQTLDFYIKCCAIEVNIDSLAHVGATLANFGICPSTGKKVFSHDTVRNTLSLMLSSGMYDHTGEFAFRVGMPAKSGIAGGLLVVIPNLLGIAVYSPPLDSHGNSVRGIEFCRKLVERFNFHRFDAKDSALHGKKDPRLP